MKMVVPKKTKASRDGKIHPLNFLRNWLHQALSYMDTGELVFRLVVESLLIAFFYFIFVSVPIGLPVYSAAILAFSITHSLNWLTNGNFWALYLFAIPSARNPGEAATLKYLQEMAARLRACKCVGGLALFGSAARGAWHDKSDLDMRIIRRRGGVNLVKANLVTMRERWIALVARQPIDLFLADDVDFLRKMRADEQPIFLIKRMDSLDMEYPGNAEVVQFCLSADSDR